MSAPSAPSTSSLLRRQRLGRRIALLALVLILGALSGLAWYAYDKGFTKKWRNFITEEFRKQGFEVSLRKLTLDPFRGLLAKDVRILDTKDGRRTWAVVDEVILGINYASALRGKTFLDTLDLRDANLFLPVDPEAPRGERVEITKLNARLFLPPQQIYLARAEAEIHGLRIYAAGRLINPQAFRPRKTEENRPLAQIATRIIKEVKELKLEGEAPVLSLQFSGDLRKPQELAADVRLEGVKIRRRDYRLEQVAIALTLRNGFVELQRCDLRDARGSFQAHALYETPTRSVEFRVRSGLDIPGLIRAYRLDPDLGHFAFYTPPEIDLTGKAQFPDAGPKLQTHGNVSVRRFAYKSVIFEELSADASWDEGRWSIRDLKVAHKTGAITGDLLSIPGEFRAKVHSTVNPNLIRPLLSGKPAEWFARFALPDSPGFDIDVAGEAPMAGNAAPKDETPEVPAEQVAGSTDGQVR